MAAASIRQAHAPDRLPDFRNLGVLARTLLIAIGACVVAALVREPTLASFGAELLRIAGHAPFVLLLMLLLLIAAAGMLRRMPYRLALATVLALAIAAGSAGWGIERVFAGAASVPVERYWLYTVLATGLVLGYFHLRGRALSPALTEARLQALQARIRPHFLFNSINAVLSLVRSEPRRAEEALEDMAELFRTVMADNRDLTPLGREVALCRQYLNLEQLRLGERLAVQWRVAHMPADALVPPLVLQPLLENAVYHGIEPRTEPGTISIDIYRKGDEVHAVLKNPYRMDGNHHAGNKMALANIRERLALHFDAEASLRTVVDQTTYQVHIVMPYRRPEVRS